MMRFSKAISLMLSLLLLLSLCGCNGLIDGERRLMRPPYPAGDAKNIQEQLTKSLGSVTLKYPKSGSYRSAIIQIDLTGDGQNEALVFYRKDDASSICLAILRQLDGEWQLISTRESEGGEVERVMFGDVNNDGANEIIVGWTIYSTGLNIISAYRFSDSSIQPIDVREFSEARANNISVAYTDMQIYDFDKDGYDEIIVSYINLSEVTATAKLIEYHNGIDNTEALSVTDTAPLDGHVLYYTQCKVNQLTDDKMYGVVLDGVKDNSTGITEYIYWDSISGDLKTPFYNTEEQSVTQTARNVSITSRDIDLDGVVDIPVTEFMPGYDASSENPIYLTSWYSADFTPDGYTLVSRKKTVLNLSENYSVTWQSAWDGKVTCRVDKNNRILYFYHYQKDKFAFSDEIFRIKSFTLTQWNEGGKDTDYFSVIKIDGETVYAASVSKGQNFVDLPAVSSYFSLL